jgi:quercetin dioxygenase-like cupin family protein
MAEFLKLVSPSEALAFLMHSLPESVPENELVDSLHAAGRVSAEDVRASQSLPSFSRSSMDGFAVRARDTFGVSESLTVENGIKTTIQVLISSQGGHNFSMRCFVIKLGGVMPKHTYTVEHAQFVLRWQASISFNKDMYTVKAGDVVFIPEGAPHWYVNNGDEDFVFLCIVPNKEDEIRMVDDNSC